MNRLKTMMLLAVLAALFAGAGYMIGGRTGLVVATMFAGIMNLGAWWFSDRLVLRMHQAREVTAVEAPELYATVQELSSRAGLPMPRVYIMAEAAPNAFATGRSPRRAAVAVTAGLLSALNREELAGVIAHELAHIRNRDTLLMSLVATLAGALSMAADLFTWNALLGGGQSSDEDAAIPPAAGLAGIILAPIVALLIQSAISRTREFAADRGGAEICGNPLALASALRKIERWSTHAPLETARPASAHLFIVNPLAGGGLVGLFRSHPPTEARVRALHALAGQPVYELAV